VTSAGKSRILASQQKEHQSESSRQSQVEEPEAIELRQSGGVYNNKADVWSMGCILYELATLRKAFDDDYFVVIYVQSGGELSVNSDDMFADDSKDLINAEIHEMLRVEWYRRPSVSSLLRNYTARCHALVAEELGNEV
jgi:serine/threonine protein kinase